MQDLGGVGHGAPTFVGIPGTGKALALLMRVFALLALVATPAHATSNHAIEETLVGWSADGKYHAVIESPVFAVRADGTFVVRRDNETVLGFGTSHKGVPSSERGGVTRIDVARFAPLEKYELRPVDGKARERFREQLELTATGVSSPPDQFPHTCSGGGWVLKRRGQAKALVTTTGGAKTCFYVRGGYLHADGKHALVKITESAWTGAEYFTITKFVAVLLES